MAKGYITGTERFPQGPQPGTGLSDVQIVENIDLIFGDNEELKFGDASDVSVKWDASNLVILPVADLTGAILIGNGTLSMDLKVFGTVATNYIEYDASEDQFNIVVASRTITGKDIALNISMVGTVGTSDYIIGLKSEVTPDGGGAIYGMAVQGILNLAERAVYGYACAAEFRLVSEGACDLPDNAVLVLATEVENTGSPPAAIPYIMLREYGTNWPANALVRFFDHSRATANNAVIISQVTDLGPFNTAIRCMVGTTPVWLYGSTVGPTTFEMAWSGAVRNKGLNFNDATFTAGSNYNLLSYGDYGNTVTLSITDYCFVMRMNVTSAANPSGVRGFSFLNLEFAQSTEAQANLWVHGIAEAFTLTQNLQWINGVNLYVDIAETLTVTQGVNVLKAGLNLTSAKTLTYHDASVILAEVTGAGVNSCSGPAASELCLLMLKVAAVSTIGSMITFFTIAGCTVTNGIYVGTGAITNFLNFESGNVGSAKVGAYNDAAQNSDGLIRILVDGTAYFIPFYGVGKVTGEW